MKTGFFCLPYILPMITIIPEMIGVENFLPFGDLIEANADKRIDINSGTCQRFNDLATIDVGMDDGSPIVNIFRAKPYSRPFIIKMMEQHPLGSQLFMPLQVYDYLVVVAKPGGQITNEHIKVFQVKGNQGVNFHKGVWHHPLLVLSEQQDFFVLDRGGNDSNLIELALNEHLEVVI